MADRPIPFSPPMVRALLKGRKTQTRRVITKPAALDAISVFGPGVLLKPGNRDLLRYAVGDRLWVREAWRTWRDDDEMSPRDILDLMDCDDDPDWRPDIQFTADEANIPNAAVVEWDPGRLRAGMHLPRRLSRLTLIVTGVKVQRLQDIDLRDAREEGCQIRNFDLFGADQVERDSIGRGAYRLIWEGINGLWSWDENPWVEAYTFTVHRGNIDAMETAHG